MAQRPAQASLETTGHSHGAQGAGPAPLLARDNVRLKACRHGPMLYLANDIYIGRSLDLYGEYSEGEAALLESLLAPGQAVVEAGANIGAHTIPMAKAVGPSGAVLAVEPQRILHQMLCANVALNALANVYAHHAGVGRTQGTLTVPALDYAAENNFGGVALQEAGPGETVARITIDAIGLSSCHLIKIDVEGMETDVVAGAAETIRRCRPLLYVENDRAERSAALIQQLFDLDYRLHWHLPPLFNPDNYFGARENAFGNVLSVNMLCVPKERAMPVSDLPEVRSAEDDWRPLVMARLRGEADKTP